MGVNILYCVKGYDVFLHGKLLQLVDECNLVIATNMHCLSAYDPKNKSFKNTFI